RGGSGRPQPRVRRSGEAVGERAAQPAGDGQDVGGAAGGGVAPPSSVGSARSVMPVEPFLRLLSRFEEQHVRHVVIGVWAANYYAKTGAEVFTTEDRDLFLPPDPENLLRAWTSCRAEGFTHWSGDEPLGEPLDRWLADRIVAQRALTSAVHDSGVVVDLTLVMAGFEFDTVWSGR